MFLSFARNSSCVPLSCGLGLGFILAPQNKIARFQHSPCRNLAISPNKNQQKSTVKTRVYSIFNAGLEWYSMRWKIETFHKILKSGCRAEESRLRTAQRLTNLIAVFCILSWRVFWLTMMNRSLPAASPTLAFTALVLHLLDRLGKDKGTRRQQS